MAPPEDACDPEVLLPRRAEDPQSGAAPWQATAARMAGPDGNWTWSRWHRGLLAASALAGLLLVTALGARRARPALRLTALGEALQAVEEHKYAKLEDTYCSSRQDRLGKMFSNVDWRECQAHCDQEPRCKAYEMLQGESDCFLHEDCDAALRAKSLFGAYVMIKTDEPVAADEDRSSGETKPETNEAAAAEEDTKPGTNEAADEEEDKSNEDTKPKTNEAADAEEDKSSEETQLETTEAADAEEDKSSGETKLETNEAADEEEEDKNNKETKLETNEEAEEEKDKGDEETKFSCPGKKEEVEDRSGCSELLENCIETRCCKDGKRYCIEKNEEYALCMYPSRCAPPLLEKDLVNPGDKPIWQTPWSCRCLG